MTGHDVMAGYSVIALVTLAALIQYFLMGLNVGRARGRLNVPAPATQGHPEFERLYRVQLNTLEWLVIFLPCLWLSAVLTSDLGMRATLWVAGLGVVWIIGRYIYSEAYVKDPSTRSRGFGIQALATLLLLLTSLVAAVVNLLPQ
jgi:glutathione S-transferase